MMILKLTGKGGVMIYDNAVYTLSEACDAYLNNTGFEPDDEADYFNFDVVTLDYLTKWLGIKEHGACKKCADAAILLRSEGQWGVDEAIRILEGG